MFRFAIAAAFASSALLFTLSPAAAHMGVSHQGCPAGQSFTVGDIKVTGAFTRATLPGAKSAGGYLTISNTGMAADRLLSVGTEASQVSQIHDMRMENGVMTMSEVPGGLEIPAGSSVVLAPSGGFHLMFMGLSQQLAEGACVDVTLRFEVAGELPVQLSVAGTAALVAPGETAPPPAGGAMDHSKMH